MATSIHETAVIDPGAKLGADVRIGPYCVVEADVSIGDNTVLEPFAHVKRFTAMGAKNHIHSYACVGGEPQDLKYHGEDSELVMGDQNTVRECVTIHRGTESGGGRTSIGSNCLLMAYVHVAHDCRLGDGIVISNATHLGGHVIVDDYAIIAGMSGVHQFVHVGEHSFLGGMSGLAQDLPPFMLANGNRAKLYGPNLIGLKRQGYANDTMRALKKAYQMLWRSDALREEALDEVEEKYPDVPEVGRLVAFIRASERGVAHACRKENGKS